MGPRSKGPMQDRPPGYYGGLSFSALCLPASGGDLDLFLNVQFFLMDALIHCLNLSPFCWGPYTF